MTKRRNVPLLATGTLPHYLVLSVSIAIALYSLNADAQPVARQLGTQSSALGPALTAPSPQRMLDLSKFGLRVVAEGGVKSVDINYGYYDCGLVNALTQPQVEQTFRLRNTGSGPLEGLRLQALPAADIQVLVAGPDQPRLAPRAVTEGMALPTLQPDRTLSLFVRWRLAGRAGGALSETILVTVPGRSRSIAALEMRATLVPLVAFSVPLFLTINPGLAPLGSIPKLYCSRQDIRILPVPLQEKDKRHSALLNKDQRAAGLFSYEVMLPADASIGTLSATLRVVSIQPPPWPSLAPLRSNVSKIPRALPPATVIAEALRAASVQIIGRVIGDISAAPAEVAFGPVTQGQGGARRVQLSVKEAGALQGMQIDSEAPWLSARLLAPRTSLPNRNSRTGSLQRQDLEVILGPDAPVGRLETRLTLTLHSGQRLTVPFAAHIEPDKGRIKGSAK